MSSCPFATSPKVERASETVGKHLLGVASDLGKHDPPPIIWSGQNASQIRIASSLASAMLDSRLKKVAKLDVFEQRLKESQTKRPKGQKI